MLAIRSDRANLMRFRRGDDPGLRRPPERLVVGASFLLVAVAALSTLAWLVRVIAHLDDANAVDHVAGTWIALATYVNEGTLYPPLYDGDHFGGTRFMPLPIVLQALGARVTGEYLVSAKLLSAALVLALALYTFLLLRRRCPSSLAFALSATLLVSGTGLVAATSIRNDTLPVLLQLAAVSLVASSRSRTTVIAAGVALRYRPPREAERRLGAGRNRHLARPLPSGAPASVRGGVRERPRRRAGRVPARQ